MACGFPALLNTSGGCGTRQITTFGSDSPRRKLLIRLRYSAWQQGIESQNPLITTVILSKPKNTVFGRALKKEAHRSESKNFHTADYVNNFTYQLTIREPVVAP